MISFLIVSSGASLESAKVLYYPSIVNDDPCWKNSTKQRYRHSMTIECDDEIDEFVRKLQFDAQQPILILFSREGAWGGDPSRSQSQLWFTVEPNEAHSLPNQSSNWCLRKHELSEYCPSLAMKSQDRDSRDIGFYTGHFPKLRESEHYQYQYLQPDKSRTGQLARLWTHHE